MWCPRHGGNVYVDSLRNPHGCFTIHSTISTALVHNASLLLLPIKSRETGDIYFSESSFDDQWDTCLVTLPDMWTIYIIYMGSCHNPPTRMCCGVNCTTTFRYMAYTFMYMDISRYGDDWTHTYLLPTGSRSHMLDLQMKNDVSKWYPRMTPYDSSSVDYFDVR